MKHKNLISAYQGEAVIDDVKAPKEFRLLKKHEIRNLNSFCDIMKQNGCVISDFDGFYIGYTIKQINKEFDLLRFGDSYILNIEGKSKLKVANKIQKLLIQMRKNYYYLKLLERDIYIFEYVENDRFYQYIINTDSIEKIQPAIISELMKTQKIDFSQDPDKMFVPSNYLISPFNSTDKFIKNEYFLTTQQEKVKNEIFESLEINSLIFFTLSANAETGKTLLMYDIAKDFINKGKKILIIHCGKLNHGHNRLMSDYQCKIMSIRSVSTITSIVKNEIKDYIVTPLENQNSLKDLKSSRNSII